MFSVFFMDKNLENKNEKIGVVVTPKKQEIWRILK